jgi:FKBP-type peptidyl-prolyl cis-trans isomerase FkpA
METLRTLLIALVLLGSFVACGDDKKADTEGRGGGNESTVDSEFEGCAEDETVETDSGLKIEDIKCGEGAEVEGDSTVMAHYTLFLENGTKIESSKDAGEPIPFSLGTGQLIAGFEEGMRGMKEGGVRKLTVPPELGYGAAENGDIPANSTLIFEIEAIEILEEPAS